MVAVTQRGELVGISQWIQELVASDPRVCSLPMFWWKKPGVLFLFGQPHTKSLVFPRFEIWTHDSYNKALSRYPQICSYHGLLDVIVYDAAKKPNHPQIPEIDSPLLHFCKWGIPFCLNRVMFTGNQPNMKIKLRETTIMSQTAKPFTIIFDSKKPHYKAVRQ